MDAAGSIPPELMSNLWRTSPATVASHLSLDDQHPWVPGKFHLYLSKLVVDAVTGRGPRFNIVSAPPRHGKSQELSKWTPVWFLEKWPTRNIINCGYGKDFATEWGTEVRKVINNHQDELSFGLSEDSKAKGRWKTDQGGGMLCAGVGSGITGKGAHLLAVDDPVKDMSEADSLKVRDLVWSWWTSTAFTRLAPDGVVFIIMTRWHEDDLAGRLTNPRYNPDWKLWKVTNFPAIYDQKAADAGPCPLGRQVGEALWPEQWPVEKLKIYQAFKEDWESLYQGRPARSAVRGNAYSSYSDSLNCVGKLERDPEIPLFWALDFNRDPMCSVIGQYREQFAPMAHLTNERLIYMEVLQELCLSDCSTKTACEAFIEATREYIQLGQRMQRGRRVNLHIYGDASGNQRSTTGDETDWQIIRKFFSKHPEFMVSYFIETKNPSVKSRVNAVNEVLLTFDNQRRLLVDQSCVELRKDLREVRFARDSSGNSTGVLDKRDPARTHLSDALGYAVSKKFGMKATSGERPGLLQ